MRKLAAAVFALVFATAALTISPQSAKADSPLLAIGGIVVGLLAIHHIARHAHAGHPHHGTLHILHRLDPRHVQWCEDRFQTYDTTTDLYYYAPGKQRHCASPYSG
ncbi:MAG: hypothetical protein ACTSP2_08655 [Alphaproteobacteria bacterium]